MGDDSAGSGDGQGNAGSGSSNYGGDSNASGDDGGGLGMDFSGSYGSLDAGMLDSYSPTIESSLDYSGLIGDYSDPGIGSNYSGSSTSASFMEDISNFFSKNLFGKFASTYIGQKDPFAGQLLGIATRGNIAGNTNSRAQGIANTIGPGLVAGATALAGPIGGLAANWGVSQLGKADMGPAYSGPTGQQQAGEMGGSGMNFGTGMGLGLGALYQNYKNNKETGGQLGTLQNMYGQNSPYAQAMRQQLARRDAASGRRSQYGPREVELQAALAGAASRNAPAINQLLAQRQNQRGQNLSQLAGLYQQMGGMGGIQRGLQGMYSDIGGMFTGMDQYDTSGYGLGNIFDTGSFNDVMPDVWGG